MSEPEVMPRAKAGSGEEDSAEQRSSAPTALGWPEDLIPRDYQPQHLGRGSQKVLRAIVDAVRPKRIELGFDVHQQIVGFVDRFLPYLPRPVAMVMPLGMHVLNLSAILRCGRPMTWLSPEQAERHLHWLMDAPIYLVREGVKGLRVLVMMGLYCHPRLQRHVGYVPQPWIDQKVAERVSRWGLRVPDLHEVAERPGGPEGVTIRGAYREQLQPDGQAIDYKATWGRASQVEIEAASRAAELARQQLADQEAALVPLPRAR